MKRGRGRLGRHNATAPRTRCLVTSSATCEYRRKLPPSVSGPLRPSRAAPFVLTAMLSPTLLGCPRHGGDFHGEHSTWQVEPTPRSCRHGAAGDASAPHRAPSQHALAGGHAEFDAWCCAAMAPNVRALMSRMNCAYSPMSQRAGGPCPFLSPRSWRCPMRSGWRFAITQAVPRDRVAAPQRRRTAAPRPAARAAAQQHGGAHGRGTARWLAPGARRPV